MIPQPTDTDRLRALINGEVPGLTVADDSDPRRVNLVVAPEEILYRIEAHLLQPGVARSEQPTDPCLSKREPGEPMFTLLGRDPVAADLVWLWAWARERMTSKITSPKKITDARNTAYDMRKWCAENAGRKNESVLDHLPFEALADAVRRRGATVTLPPYKDEAATAALSRIRIQAEQVAQATKGQSMSDAMQVQGSSLRPADVAPALTAPKPCGCNKVSS